MRRVRIVLHLVRAVMMAVAVMAVMAAVIVTALAGERGTGCGQYGNPQSQITQ